MHTPLTSAEHILDQSHKLRQRYRYIVVASMIVLLLVSTIGMSIGAVAVPYDTVWHIIGSHIRGVPSMAPSGTDTIIWQIRAPRVALSILVGGALAVVGVAVQAMVRNPLADPYILGVAPGAAAGAVAVIFFGGVARNSIIEPAFGGFIGAILTLLLVFALARQQGRLSSIRLLLVGVSLSYALSGLTTFMQYATHDPAGQAAILFWLIGGLGGADWSKIPFMTIVMSISALTIWYYARPLNALAIGDEAAMAMGLQPDQLRLRLFVVLSLVTAVAVSMVGPIGFVGLVVPHIVRLIVGAEHRRVIPLTLIVGSIYLTSVDIVARTVVAPSELPVGILTAMLGTPFFIWLIRRRDSQPIKEVRS
jgi:iron complex transport system permease protein